MSQITVVIPAWNDAEMLRVALQALSQQLRPADEIIVVDNASTDDTAAVAQAAGVTVVYEPIQGIWPAASAGYDAARGDIIARLDADSIPPVDWLMHIDAEFTLSPEADVITGPGDFYGCNALTAVLGGTLYIGGFFFAMGFWLTQSPIFGSNFAMRREVWLDVRDRVHRTRIDVHDDLDLSLHLGPGVTVAYEPSLRVGISARPFSTWSGFSRRLRWAFRTLAMHLPEETPWRRAAVKRGLAAAQSDRARRAA